MKRFLLWKNRIGYVGFSDKCLNELDLRVDTDHMLTIFVFKYLIHVNSSLIYMMEDILVCLVIHE